MARQEASIKSTSGAGFLFERKVGAYYLACMLNGDAPLGDVLGTPTRLDFQVRVQGWFLDDVLVQFDSGKRIALSIKSNQQITRNALPEEFVRDCWEMYLS